MLDQTNAPHHVMALTIDSERIVGAIVDLDGKLTHVNALPYPRTEGQETIVRTIVTLVNQVVMTVPPEMPTGVGVAVSAPVQSPDNAILYSDQDGDHLNDLVDFPLAQILQSELALPVTIENRVNAMALAEAYLGAGQSADTMFYICVDTHLRGISIQGGDIRHGIQSNASQISNLVADWMGTRPITLGQRASGDGITGEYNIRSRKHRTPTVDEIIQYALQGDHLAIRVIRDGAHILGSVLCPVMTLLNPSVVVVGGRFAHAGDIWWPNFVKSFLDSEVLPGAKMPIKRAHFDEDAALQGAALIARMLNVEHDSS